MKKKKCLISERAYNKDFSHLASFWAYYVKKRELPISLNEIQNFGVHIEVKNRIDLGKMSFSKLPHNTIFFTSTRKKLNVKNLMWNIRCLVAHPENIREVKFEDKKFYRKTKKIVHTMKGLIQCDMWPLFIKKLTEKIKNETA